MSNNTIRVVCAVLDQSQLTLYKEDGHTFVIPQGDARIQRIIDTIAPTLAMGTGMVAEVDVSQENHYQRYQEKTNGLVRLFRVAKNTLFGAKKPEIQIIGSVDAVANRLAAVKEIMDNAVPVTHHEFTDEGMDSPDSTHTIVAVVNGQVVPGFENLKSQMINSVADNSTVGLDNFMKRIAAVIDQRQHSVNDLLNFMKRGDLPIADDGSIVIYKALRRKEDGYVDIHSGRVTQRIGSFVHMDKSLVDPDRRNECSNGLHVARRQYLRGFPGDVCVLAKVAPEDAIAVPEYDANKMRVCAYHILFELPREGYSALMNNEPFTTNSEAQQMLGAVIAGNHTAITEFVKITGEHGTGLVITPVEGVTGTSLSDQTRLASAISEFSESSAPVVDVNVVHQQAQAVVAQSRAEKAQGLHVAFSTAKPEHQSDAAQALLDFKRSAKVSWEKLGLPADTTELLLLAGAE